MSEKLTRPMESTCRQNDPALLAPAFIFVKIGNLHQAARHPWFQKLGSGSHQCVTSSGDALPVMPIRVPPFAIVRDRGKLLLWMTLFLEMNFPVFCLQYAPQSALHRNPHVLFQKSPGAPPRLVTSSYGMVEIEITRPSSAVSPYSCCNIPQNWRPAVICYLEAIVKAGINSDSTSTSCQMAEMSAPFNSAIIQFDIRIALSAAS
jgi:hypothetical protein